MVCEHLKLASLMTKNFENPIYIKWYSKFKAKAYLVQAAIKFISKNLHIFSLDQSMST